jgi:ribosomal protein S18 acetylase RimI-like enzyme
MDTVIRQATEADFEQVGKVFAQENRFHAKLLPEIFKVAEPIMTHEWYDEILSNPHKALFVAELGSAIIAVLLLKVMTSPDDPIFQPRRYVYVDEIAVEEIHRGQGVGQSLMRKAGEWALAQGAREIELNVWETNTRAILFYENLGYTTIRRTMKLTLCD